MNDKKSISKGIKSSLLYITHIPHLDLAIFSIKNHSVNYKIEVKKLYSKKGRPTKKMEPVREEWYILGSIKEDNPLLRTTRTKNVFFVTRKCGMWD